MQMTFMVLINRIQEKPIFMILSIIIVFVSGVALRKGLIRCIAFSLTL